MNWLTLGCGVTIGAALLLAAFILTAIYLLLFRTDDDFEKFFQEINRRLKAGARFSRFRI